MRKCISVSGCFILVLGLLFQCSTLSAQDKVDYSNIPKSDCHLHLLDFLQNGEYWSEEDKRFVAPAASMALKHGDRGKRIVGVLKRMQDANVQYAMVSGMPFVKKWSRNDAFRAGYYLDSASRVVRARDTDYTVALSMTDYMEKYPEHSKLNRDKLYPFVSGFDSTDMGAVDMIIKRMKEFPGLWEGIGEVMSRHDDLTNLSTGERPAGNHPALHRICDFAGAFHVPVSIHHNIAPVSASGKPHPPYYLREIVELFDRHPDTKFIWCHAGISRRVVIDDLPQQLLELLSGPGRKEHVYIDLSWVVFENYIYNLPDGAAKPKVDNRKAWAKLISTYPGNFVIGSDAVAKFDKYKKEINKFAPLFDSIAELPGGDKVVQQVALKNFQEMMQELRQKRGGAGVVLPPTYQYPELNFTKDKEGRFVYQPPVKSRAKSEELQPVPKQ